MGQRPHGHAPLRFSAYGITTSVMACTFGAGTFPMRKEKVFFPTRAQGKTDELPWFLSLLLGDFFFLSEDADLGKSMGGSESPLPWVLRASSQIVCKRKAQRPDNWGWLRSQGGCRVSLVSVLFSFLVSEYFNFFSCRFSYSFRLMFALSFSSKKYLWLKGLKCPSQPK